MKPRHALLLLFAGMLLGPAGSMRAQMLGAEDITSVYDLVKTFKRIIPYRDEANHLTITHVFMNTDYRYIKLTVFYDADQTIDAETPSRALNYLAHHDLWSLAPLADHTFDLRVVVAVRDKPVGGQYNFSTLDLQNALSPPAADLARSFLAKTAQSFSADCPILLSESGERLSSMVYDSAARMLTAVYEYPDTVWPGIRDYILLNTDAVRRFNAHSLIADTANGFVAAAQVGEVTLQYRYRDYARTDSAEVNIAPWMWESLYDGAPAEVDTGELHSLSDTLLMLSLIAEGVSAECPTAVDSFTTMISCIFDSVNRVMTYTYRVDELAMLNIEGNAEAQNSLSQGIQQVLVTDDALPLVQLLLSAQATLVYHYSSPRSRAPLTFTFTPDQLEELMASAQ
ncbi:MAG: hypothetical protein IJ785_08070 [Bacteroidales bacterium]|nr:hypothetical protein [Bacteroidales bacterium]